MRRPKKASVLHSAAFGKALTAKLFGREEEAGKKIGLLLNQCLFLPLFPHMC